MPSFEYTIDEKSRVGARFLSRVKEEIQRAFSIEKRERKLTQQSVAQKLGVNRSVVNRQLMGYENMTTRSIAEMLWAIGWEPHFEVRPIVKQRDSGIPSPKLFYGSADSGGKIALSVDGRLMAVEDATALEKRNDDFHRRQSNAARAFRVEGR